MPEIGEVARIVHYIHKHLVGKTLATIKAQHDENVFGKVGTSAAEFEKALTGKKILDARQQGKYFWLVMSSPPHPLMHFGMAGWFKIRNEETAYYKPTKPEEPMWPPKYWKFILETAEEPKCEAAFVDFRRFARIRLLDCAADDIRQTTPLKENGPDPVIDQDVLTKEWLSEKLGSKKIPVKALLLDQANISGIGNWVGDEILYHAHIHPEQYSNTFSAAQIHQLHTSLHHVCSLAVSTHADSSKFPDTWLFKYRWGKGKKDDPNRLPNGDKIVFLKVGGRTSAVVPSVQKKTGPVAGDVEGGKRSEGGEEVKSKGTSKNVTKKSGKGKKKAVKEDEEDDEEDKEEELEQEEEASPVPTPSEAKKRTIKHEVDATENDGIAPNQTPKKRKAPAKANPKVELTSDEEENVNGNAPEVDTKSPANKKRKSTTNAKTEPDSSVPEPEVRSPASKKQKTNPKPSTNTSTNNNTPAAPKPATPIVKDKKPAASKPEDNGRRRSARVSTKVM